MLQTKFSRYKYTPDEMSEDQFLKRFVLRNDIYEDIFEDIKSWDNNSSNQHYIIIGQRGQGKTTLLRKIYIESKNDKKLNKYLLCIKFAEEQYQIRTLTRLWEEIAEYLEDMYADDFPNISDVLETHYEDDDYDLKAFGLLEKEIKKKKKKLLILVDNIDELIAKLSLKEQRRFREILLSSKIFKIIGGSTKMLEQHYDYSQPFYEFFKIIKLKGFTLEESKIFLLALANKDEKEKIENIIKNTPNRIEIIRQLTGGVPRTLVMLFDIFLDDEGDSFEDLLKILDEVTPLYKHRMDDLPAQLQDIVHTIAINWDGIYTKEIALKTKLESKTVSAQLKKLEKYEIVESITVGKNKIYKIKERFFNIWYLMRFGRKKDRQRVEWLISFLTSWCTKEELESKAQELISKLKNGQVKVFHAFHMAEALRYTSLNVQIELSLKEELKKYLKSIDSSFYAQVSETNTDLFKESLKFETYNIEKSIKILKQTKEPNNAILWQLGSLYNKNKEYEKAESVFSKILAWSNPSDQQLLSVYVLSNIFNERVVHLLKNVYSIDKNKLCLFVYSLLQLKDEKFTYSLGRIKEYLNFNLNIKDEILCTSEYLLLLISKKQYIKAKEFLEDKDYNFKEKIKPLWFALMTLMKDEYPNEIKKMGSELEGSVNNVLKRISEYQNNGNILALR
ncbi:MAG: NACHT domain-containing protein [Campylobacteraceae bacterium]|nr:NACHT domain-containing protein [Campylobacteraceae bacterium]